MEEKNTIYINKEQLEELIKSKYNIKKSESLFAKEPYFHYILKSDKEPAEFVIVSEKFMIKDYENSRQIIIDESDIEFIIKEYLSDTDYFFESFVFDYDHRYTFKTFKGLIVFLIKKEVKKLEKTK